MVMRSVALSIMIGCAPIIVAESSAMIAKNNAPNAAMAEYNMIQEKIDALQAEIENLQTTLPTSKPNKIVPEPAVMEAPIQQNYTTFKQMSSAPIVEDLGLKPTSQKDQDQDQPDQMQMQQSMSTEPWEQQGYEQSVKRAKTSYQSEEKAKCTKKLYYYTTKLEMHPKNEFYKYQLNRWLKKCK